MFFFNLIPFTISTWLGFFLISRGQHPRLRLAAYGLLVYAAALLTKEITYALRLFPPIFWVGAILHLDQRVTDKHSTLLVIWKWALLPITFLLSAYFAFDPTASQKFPFNWFSFLIGLTPLIWILILIQDYISLLKPRQATGVLFVATIFFALGEGVLLLSLNLVIQQYMLPGIGIDLLFLGFCMAWFDALDEGETFLPEMIRSFILTFIIILIFAGQIGFVVSIQTGLTDTMKILMTTTIIASTLIAVFGGLLQNKLDEFAFSRTPSVRDAKKRLQAESAILARKDPEFNLKAMSDDERSRITRRALSHFGDLTRLASNPLTQLPTIEGRLKSRNAPDTTLDRAAELKIMLTESISKLKPQHDKPFDTTDEWRFYNSVFFPYVAGLRPYSRNQEKDLQPYEGEALEWFQSFVPERTLHNWQNTAAKLIANDLWENNWQ